MFVLVQVKGFFLFAVKLICVLAALTFAVWFKPTLKNVNEAVFVL